MYIYWYIYSFRQISVHLQIQWKNPFLNSYIGHKFPADQRAMKMQKLIRITIYLVVMVGKMKELGKSMGKLYYCWVVKKKKAAFPHVSDNSKTIDTTPNRSCKS